MSDQRLHFTDQRYVFFVTFSVYRRRRLLDADHPQRIVLGVLNHLLESLNGRTGLSQVRWLRAHADHAPNCFS
ncbi:MAG: hypothetical protein ABI614_17075, partial [Planctomycetota bacterium]